MTAASATAQDPVTLVTAAPATITAAEARAVQPSSRNRPTDSSALASAASTAAIPDEIAINVAIAAASSHPGPKSIAVAMGAAPASIARPGKHARAMQS